MPLPSTETRMEPDGKQVPVERSIKFRARVRNIVKAQFEDWIEYRARRRLFDMQEGENPLNPLEFKMSMQELTKSIASYTLAWNGDACNQALVQVPGMCKMYMLLMKDGDRLLEKSEGPAFRPQPYTESDILTWMNDEVIGHLLADAFGEIRKASPNFHQPPVRGMED